MIRMGGTKMSKSKGNLVDPGQYFSSVGADALRLFHLFVGPPADDVDWSEQADEVIEGCSRFLARVWRLGTGEVRTGEPGGGQARARDELRRATHQLVARVSDDYDRWSYNTAVAACMEFTNLLHKQAQAGADQGDLDFAVDRLLLLMAPMAPHVTAELWERRHGKGEKVHEQPWPEFDPVLAAALTETMVVQVNGKVRDRIEVDVGIGDEEMQRLAVASPKVQAALDGRTPAKVIARPPKLVNLVV
jgi:leucyl-tRNA synthetase